MAIHSNETSSIEYLLIFLENQRIVMEDGKV